MKGNSRKSAAWAVIVIVLLGSAVYANSLTGKFIYDDNTLIKHNENLKSFSRLPKALSEDLGSGIGVVSNFYRPVQVISYMLDYSVWKLNPLGFHITNVALHILVSLCLFWMLSIIFCAENAFLPALAAILYLIHPVHTEAVSYISSRADLLAGLFVLLAIVFYIKQASLDKAGIFFLILSSYLLALYSKEYSLITPALILLYSRIFKKKLLIKELFLLSAIAAIYIVFRMAISRASEATQASTTLLERTPGFFVAAAEYIRLLFLPFDLRMGYGNQLFSWHEPRALLGAGFTVILLAYAVIKRNSSKLFAFSILWFFITLLPQANLYPINAFMAEHWLYLPAMGFCLALAWALVLLRKNFRYAGNILIALIVAFYSFLTIKQNMTWREPVSFYERYLRYRPYDWRIYVNLGVSLEDRGDTGKAIEAYIRSLEINPKEINTYIRLSNIYYKTGDTDKALGVYKDAIRVNPGSALLYYRLGVFYGNINKEKEAADAYNESIRIDKDFAPGYMGLGKAYRSLGRPEEAREMYKRAASLLSKALESEPDFAAAHRELAEAYYYTGEYDLAVRHCDRARELGFDVDKELLDELKPFRAKH